MAKKKTKEPVILEGLLCRTSNGEEYNLLGLVLFKCEGIKGEDQYQCVILADLMSKVFGWQKEQVTLQYYTADKLPDDWQVEYLKEFYGVGTADYGIARSDVTGYLWTDEKLVVGGHDVMTELKSFVGKWLRLEIVFGGKPDEIGVEVHNARVERKKKK